MASMVHGARAGQTPIDTIGAERRMGAYVTEGREWERGRWGEAPPFIAFLQIRNGGLVSASIHLNHMQALYEDLTTKVNAQD